MRVVYEKSMDEVRVDNAAAWERYRASVDVDLEYVALRKQVEQFSADPEFAAAERARWAADLDAWSDRYNTDKEFAVAERAKWGSPGWNPFRPK